MKKINLIFKKNLLKGAAKLTNILWNFFFKSIVGCISYENLIILLAGIRGCLVLY